jgi:hypothetical protein
VCLICIGCSNAEKGTLTFVPNPNLAATSSFFVLLLCVHTRNLLSYHTIKHQEIITMASNRNTTDMEQADFLLCQRIIEEFKRPKHRKYVRSFLEPVDIVAVPTYLNVIRQPMDLSTIAFKLGKNIYGSAAAFKADFELMLDNSDIFNAGQPPSPVFEHGRQMREELNLICADHHNWLRRVHPHIFNKIHLEEDKENMDEPPTKKRRRSSRLVATAESSPTTQSPYTAASVIRKSTSNPVTPASGVSKKPSKGNASKPETPRADSVSSPFKPSVATQVTALLVTDSLVSKSAETEVPAPRANEPTATVTQTTSGPSKDQTRNKTPAGPA